MAESAVGFFLENTQQLLLYNADLILDAKEQVEALHKDILWFKAYLKDASEKRVNSNLLQELVNRMTAVVYKAEDVIDKFVVEEAVFKSKNTFGRTRRVVGRAANRRSIALEVQAIRGEVNDINKILNAGFKELHLADLPSAAATMRKPPVLIKNEDVVGFDEEARTVIGRLTNADSDLDIITIIGMPGLGKTTLARKVYTDPEIEYKFFTRAWVYVSQNYSQRKVLLSILSIFADVKNYADKSDDSIVDELHNRLAKGKYLIVLDDVWSTGAWNALKAAFPDNGKGSRILITSRQREVANNAIPNKGPHALKFLSEEKSWELLEKRVFGKKKCTDGEMEKLGRHIATECKGLPLALVVIAGVILDNYEGIHWWRQVADNVDKFIVKDQEQFMDVIAMSYNILPYHLKSCFLYLGMFPEDYEIPVWKLMHLWIAEGFIEQDGRIWEDIAEDYVVNLVNRNLLMAVERRSNGQIKTCRVHDMLYEFCKKEAEKLNFFKEIKSFEDVTTNPRRVSFHAVLEEDLDTKTTSEHVRSFLSFAKEEFKVPSAYLTTIPRAFNLVRVLDIKSLIFEMFPKEIAGLVLLRYLALSCNIKTLPASVSKLWNLQTLIFMTSHSTLDLKEEFWKMYQLRHLRTNASAQLPAPKSTSTQNARENVQSLTTISPESCTNQVFKRCPNVKKLGVRGQLNILFEMFDNLGKLVHLTNLKLFNDQFGSKIESLPPPYKFPKKLRKLTLSDTSLQWDQMVTLGSLENLEVLKLKENAFKGEFWEPQNGGFASLKVLHIDKTDLVKWEASKHHFPTLNHLVLKHCDKLEGVPTDFAEIPSFKVLEIHRCDKAVASAKEIQKKKSGSNDGLKLSIYPPEEKLN